MGDGVVYYNDKSVNKRFMLYSLNEHDDQGRIKLYGANIVSDNNTNNEIKEEVKSDVKEEVKSMCEKYMMAQIDIMNPKAILFCGATALKSFWSDPKVQISKTTGNWFTVNINGKDYKAMAVFHPSYLLRNHSMEEGSPRRLMQKDLMEVRNTILSDKVFNDMREPALV